MLKLWDRQNGIVHQESGIFAGSDKVNLLFPAKKIFRVYTPAIGMEYFPDRDFEYVPGTAVIRRTPESRIPFLSKDELRPGKGAPCFPASDAIAVSGAVDGGLLRFDNRNFFAEHQFCVDYAAEEISFNPDLSLQHDRLPRFREKLKEGKGTTVKITLIGDSISEGFNATSFTRHEPFAPAYSTQVCRELEDRFRIHTELRNLAIEGSGCQEAESNPDRWRTPDTDLYIIAYGMNDFYNMTAEEFAAVHRHLMELARTCSPQCEFLFVTSMTGNPLWERTVPGKDREFASAIRQFVQSCGSCAALADVQKVWLMLLERKSFYDLTGNGVNHPNDFGHRVYASVLAGVLTETPYL